MNLKQFDLDGLSTLWLVSRSNIEFRATIENELQMQISNNKNFSREFIFKITKILNHALGVHFIPSSEAHKLYGAFIVIDMLLNDDELIEMTKNYSSNPPKNSHGLVRATASNGLSEEQLKLLAETGFSTQDILRTENYK
ncbi:hypothetical protein [Aurantibacillus circumpalustris]|uniref:hypothetical protein n=1 Tax=Aurantibacillus circumpalustris TaxID=3036359 RepID=UPI00295A8252|nr:hypothetical protein [Aurantibacillus circumpalustris]